MTCNIIQDQDELRGLVTSTPLSKHNAKPFVRNLLICLPGLFGGPNFEGGRCQLVIGAETS
jgi:hypothetical protein